VVQGQVDPDEFWVHKATARAGFRSVLRRDLGSKAFKLVYGSDGSRDVERQRVSAGDRARPVLNDDEILELSRWAMRIEDHYSQRSGRSTPMDIEWAKDGRSGELFIVQARPETVHSQAPGPLLQTYRLRGSGEILTRGKNVGGQIASGAVRVIHGVSELSSFQQGEVLVAGMTDPDWEPILRRAAAVVTDHGGRTCHAAIVAREIGIPCVVGTGNATRELSTGTEVTVSCASGDEGLVYRGRIPFERSEIDLSSFGTPSVPLMLNLANPDAAFQLAQLPSAGVGLLRIEFLINHWIGIHPMALLHPERVPEPQKRSEIARRISTYESGEEFFIDRMASGVAVIAAAFHPRPVTVRFSDFKTNEYAGLLGGRSFEPEESNPMIGLRGASRYYDERYREAFALECRAIRRVREDMGLTNVRVMIPFCRTLEEARRVQAEMKQNGLERGSSDLEVWVMCEIPNNVMLAEEFSEFFDGFSIGSNDLTQLTLGVDRDSELLSHIFDERDPGVKRMIFSLVETAHRCGRPVGICGQAPSDHPDFAEYLVSIGIDSISLTPDSLPEVARRLDTTKPDRP
jgi:pyruvate,water dikinase